MVHSTADWCEISRPKPAVVAAKEKKTATVAAGAVKNGRESKGAGSRRIFSPVFKLQVLDSYRQDADCQGNQRATARKYGIHRRQIQKWLQMETNLRLSVQKTSASALNLTSVAVRHADAATKECVVSSSSSSCELEVKPPSRDGCRSVPGAPHSPHSVHHEPIVDSRPSTEASGSASDSEEYVNVDEITDSEDDADTSSCCSWENGDQALDLTSATLSKRRFYTADFKAHVLDAFRHDRSCRGNQRATARKFGIHRRQVQKWLNQEASVRSQSSNDAAAERSSAATACLDLSATSASSHKRKLEEVDDLHAKRAKRLAADEVQESALCLVKHADRLAKVEPVEQNNNDSGHYHHHILYPATTAATLEHSYGGGAGLGYLKPEYPLCVYQPWHCCYQQILSARSGLDAAAAAMLGPASKAYSYAFNVKYEASYVDIPVQYGFGDSVPSKWLKENPLFLHGPPSPYPCP